MTTTHEAILATAARLREQADVLEQLARSLSEGTAPEPTTLTDSTFDPDTDAPPVSPYVNGTRAQQDWTCVMLWGQLLALNVRQNRGATRIESRSIAKSAGYRDGRAWNAWTEAASRKDDEGARWITGVGKEHLRFYLNAVGRTLPEDLHMHLR